ncbi:MAG: ABC transporter permease [Catenulispora sp.]|nr:ABC transporter permease [Catenulispora sp.]
MTAQILTPPRGPQPHSRPRLLPEFRMTGNGFRTLVRTQAKLLSREPTVVLAGVVLPVALIVVFGLVPSFTKPAANLGGKTTLDVYVPTFAMLSSVLTALTALPVTFADLRERGVLRRLAVSPVPAAGLLAAQVTVLVAAAASTATLVVLIGTVGFGAELPVNLGLMLASYVLGTTALISLGLLIAAKAPAAGVATGFGVPTMIVNFFFAGVYVPLQQLPHLLRTVSGFVPYGAIVDTWSGSGAAWQHLLVLAGYTVVGSLAAARFFKWE